VQTLISTALDHGSRDNATAIAVTVSDSTAEKPKKEQKQSKKGILFAAIAGLALAGTGIAALLLR